MSEFAHNVLKWIESSIAWIVIALSGGTLFALKRGSRNIQTWIGVLIKSGIVGFIASLVVRNTDWDSGWQFVAVAFFAFSADAILYLLDVLITKAVNDPVGLLRTLLGWIISKKLVISEDTYRKLEKSKVNIGDKDGNRDTDNNNNNNSGNSPRGEPISEKTDKVKE